MEDNTPKGLIDPTESGPVNPARYFAEWKSTEECFVYYDKATKTKNVKLPMPFVFIPLAKAICIKGYHEPEKTSYISNEVKNGSKDTFVVTAYNNVIKKSKVAFVGTWEQIKTQASAVDASWVESIYGAAKDEKGNLFIMNVQLTGAGMTHWFDFIKNNKVWGNAVCVKEMTNEKKGSNKYKAPRFSTMPISTKSNLEAAELQKEIMEHLNDYWKGKEAEIAAMDVASPQPVSQPAAPAKTAPPSPAATKSAIEPINFGTDDNDDAPF